MTEHTSYEVVEFITLDPRIGHRQLEFIYERPISKERIEYLAKHEWIEVQTTVELTSGPFAGEKMIATHRMSYDFLAYVDTTVLETQRAVMVQDGVDAAVAERLAKETNR